MRIESLQQDRFGVLPIIKLEVKRRMEDRCLDQHVLTYLIPKILSYTCLSLLLWCAILALPLSYFSVASFQSTVLFASCCAGMALACYMVSTLVMRLEGKQLCALALRDMSHNLTLSEYGLAKPFWDKYFLPDVPLAKQLILREGIRS